MTKHSSSKSEALMWVDEILESDEISSISARKHEFSLSINFYRSTQ